MNLPNGWASAKLGELTELNPPKDQIDAPSDKPMAFVPMASVKEEFGGVDVSSVRPFETVKKGYVQFRERDVLFAKITPCMENGKVAVVPKLESPAGYGSTEFHIVRAPDAVNPRWIAHFLSQHEFRRVARRNMSGSAGQLRVPEGWLAEQTIPIASAQEQQRIVEKLDELLSDLEAATAALERVRANLKRYRAAVLKAAVEGRLTEKWRAAHPDVEPASKLLERILVERRKNWEEAQLRKYADKGQSPPKGWREKYSEPLGLDASTLPPLPENWIWVRAEQVCDFITKGTTPSSSQLFNGGGDVPFIKVYNLTSRGSLDFAVNPTFVSHQTHSAFLARSCVFPGDILMNIVGPPLGKVSIVPDQFPEWNINQAIAIFRPVVGFDRRYLASCLLTETISDWAVARGKATAGQINLTLEICRDLPLPLAPSAEQAVIAQEVSKHSSIVEAQEEMLSTVEVRAGRLRQSILKRAFEGKLVPQDPKDEPASELLARIRAGRSAEVAKEKKRGGRRAA